MHARLLQSCPTLCDPLDCSLPARLLCPWDAVGKNSGVACHALLQGIFLTWVKPASPAAPALQADSLSLSHKGSPIALF